MEECDNHFLNCAEYESNFGTDDPTAPGLNVALSGLNFLDCLASSKSMQFPVIFDSGASVAISGHKGDYVGEILPPFRECKLGGMANGTRVEGIGLVHWTFHNGHEALTLALKCYYVPDCWVHLLSPECLFNASKGITGQFAIREDCSSLEIDNHPKLILDYDSLSHLPIGLAYNGRRKANNPSLSFLDVNLCITDEENQNLTPAQKLLMMWHYKFGHCNMAKVQRILQLPVFMGEKFQSAAKAVLPKCATCCYANAHARSTEGNVKKTNPVTDGARSRSTDHFECRLKGRTYSSYDKATSEQYVGGCFFVDHMSDYIHVEQQLGFSSSETIRAKQNFEQMALGRGML